MSRSVERLSAEMLLCDGHFAQQLTCIGLLISCTLPACSEQVQRAWINGAVPASFVSLVLGICFCDCGESEACCEESVDARKSYNPFDGSYSDVVVVVAEAGVCF